MFELFPQNRYPSLRNPFHHQDSVFDLLHVRIPCSCMKEVSIKRARDSIEESTETSNILKY